MKKILLGTLLLSVNSCSSTPFRSPSSQGNSLPLTGIVKYDQAPNLGYVIPVTFSIGDKKVTKNLLLDTGSSGIFVLAGELADIGLAGSGPAMKMPYAGGQYFSGYSESVQVSFGDGFSGNMPVGIATEVGCSNDKPKCPFSKGSADLIKHGYSGYIGTSPRASGGFRLDNPLVQIQNYSGNYLISGCDKRFVLNPSPQDLQGFNFIQLTPYPKNFANGRPSWVDSSIPVNYSLAGEPVGSATRLSSVDTGVTAVLLSGSDIKTDWISGVFLKSGLAVQISVPSVFLWSFVSTTNSVYASQSLLLGPHNSILGAPFLLNYDVYFDLQQGRVGIWQNKRCSSN